MIAIVVGGLVHLRRLAVPLISFVVGFLIALAFIGPIVEFTMRPLLQMPPSLAYTHPPNARHLYTQVAALAGFVLATPVLFYQLWVLVAPGPSGRRRWLAIRFACIGSGLFVTGALMSHFVFFPWAWSLLTQTPAEDVGLIRLQPAFFLYAELLIVCGLLCPMPASVLLLTRVGAITPDLLLRNFWYASALIVTVAAVVTPTPDVITLAVAAAPLFAVYSLSAVVARISGSVQRRA